jgi:hypothetical protein
MYKNIIIAHKPNINFLGIMLIEKVKWHAHIDILCNRFNFFYEYFQSCVKYGIIFCLTDSCSKNVRL